MDSSLIEIIRCSYLYVDRHDGGTGTLKHLKRHSFYWYQQVITSNRADL